MTKTIRPTERDVIAARKTRQLLGKVRDRRKLSLLSGADSEPIELPTSVREVVELALDGIAAGHTLEVTALAEEMTTQEAAEYLNVSRPFLIKLLDQGAMRYRRVGTHRRVQREDVVRFKREQDQASEAAMRELAGQARELRLDEA
jgi:excisionase family DNA binding protein